MSRKMEPMGTPDGKVTLMVGTKRGGVGKTLLSCMLVDMLRAAGNPSWKEGIGKPGYAACLGSMAEMLDGCARPNLSIMDVDVVAGSTELSSSALGRRFGDKAVLPVPIAPSARQLVANISALKAHFDLIVNIMVNENAVIDLGANVVASVTDWARDTQIGSDVAEAGNRVDFIAVTTADRGAMEDAYDALTRVQNAFGRGNHLRLFLAINHFHGSYETLSDTVEAKALGTIHGLRAFNIPKLSIEFQEHVEASGVPLFDLATRHVDDVINTLPIIREAAYPKGTGKRIQAGIAVWYEEVLKQMKTVGLLDPLAVQAKAA